MAKWIWEDLASPVVLKIETILKVDARCVSPHSFCPLSLSLLVGALPVLMLCLVASVAEDLKVRLIEASALHFLGVVGVFDWQNMVDCQPLRHLSTLLALPVVRCLHLQRKPRPSCAAYQSAVVLVFAHRRSPLRQRSWLFVSRLYPCDACASWVAGRAGRGCSLPWHCH